MAARDIIPQEAVPPEPPPELPSPIVSLPREDVALKDDGAEADSPVPDAYELAQEAAACGRAQEGIELLSREVAQQRSGRGRFHRKLQLALVCMSVGHESVAYPILQALTHEIEERKLADWEEPSAVAEVLVLSFRCLEKLGIDPEQKQKLYREICCLDPCKALSLSM